MWFRLVIHFLVEWPLELKSFNNLVSTVQLLLSHRAISPNGIHPPGSGTTPLHLAACLGRVDVVNLLLEQENIDDSLRDSQGKTCRDVARGKEVSRAIDGTLFYVMPHFSHC